MNVANPAPGVVATSPASRNYENGFMSELMLKDLEIAQSSAKSVDLNLEFVNKVTEIYQQIVKTSDAKKDFGVAFQHRKKSK